MHSINRKTISGFTLIEIVMVLVLIGILSAVAVPKYFDLQEQAQEQAMKSVVAEIQARINASFSRNLLRGETCTAALKLDASIGHITYSDSERLLIGNVGDYGFYAIFSDGKSISEGSIYKGSETVYTIKSTDLVLPSCDAP